jgi:hypothetical protein
MTQQDILSRLQKDYETVQFVAGDTYYWSPRDKRVFYPPNDQSRAGLWALLHETSHGALGHHRYRSDFELVLMEAEAWIFAQQLGASYGISIDDDHIQDCLDSYRDWQYKRSICPTCHLGGVQINTHTYYCLFCDGQWRVSSARFCRPYRRTTK